MKHALVVAHPNPKSFTLTMTHAYAEALRHEGEEVLVRDLYGQDFDPRLLAGELPNAKGFEARADVKSERTLLKDVDCFALFYPVWFNAPPAMLKGYIERVFGMGFGYGMGQGGNEPLLTGRRLISFSSSGAPKSWMVETGAWAAVRNLFDEHVSRVCGFGVVDHIHFGDIVPGITPEAVERCSREVRAAARKYFGRNAA